MRCLSIASSVFALYVIEKERKKGYRYRLHYVINLKSVRGLDAACISM